MINLFAKELINVIIHTDDNRYINISDNILSKNLYIKYTNDDSIEYVAFGDMTDCKIAILSLINTLSDGVITTDVIDNYGLVLHALMSDTNIESYTWFDAIDGISIVISRRFSLSL